MKTLHVLIVAFGMVLPVAASAQTERPQPIQELFFTETVYPQDRGEVQLTITSLIDRTGSEEAGLLPVSFELGLTDRWQVEAGWAGYASTLQSPMDFQTARYSIGTKYSFMDIGHSHVHAAVGFDVEFPNEAAFADNAGEDNTEYEPFVSMAVDLTHRVTVFGSAGASLELSQIVDGERPDDIGTLSAGALVAFHYATFALEYTNRSDTLPWRLDGSPLLTPSLVLHPGGEWELGFGFPIGVREGSRTPGFAMNIIKEFGGR
jgi:hypothetical protein